MTTRFFKAGLAVCTISALCLTAGNAGANLLTNPGFEDPIASGPAPFVGRWEPFSGSANASAFNSAVNPLSGAQHLELVIAGDVNSFAGVFQDVSGLTVGQELTWSGWALDVGADGGGSEVRIEWRDSVANTEVGRTPNTVPALTGAYTEWSVVDVVPAGADSARVVYAIQSFGAGVNQNIYIDDASVTVIPEPASLVLLALGGLAIVLRRRA